MNKDIEEWEFVLNSSIKLNNPLQR